MIDTLSIYLNQIATIPLLNTATQQELATRAKSDPDARQRLIEANLRLVVPVARSFTGAPMPLMDRIQEGNIGLIKAAETYNPDQGALFATWATNRIKWHIYRAIQQRGHLISIPVHVQDSEQVVRGAFLRLVQHMDRLPRHSEVRAESGLIARRYRSVIDARKTRHMLSLDAPLNDESNDTLYAVIADRPIETDDDLTRDIHDALATLPANEQHLLTALFGLNDTAPCAGQQMADALGVSRASVSRAKANALGQLRTALKDVIHA